MCSSLVSGKGQKNKKSSFGSFYSFWCYNTSMTKHTTLFLLNDLRESVRFYGDVRAAITGLREQYSDQIPIKLDGEFADEEAVCEEIFDLTNNPQRQEERTEKYGRGRSVSVGDIVGVDNEKSGITTFYVCAPSGWVKI